MFDQQNLNAIQLEEDKESSKETVKLPVNEDLHGTVHNASLNPEPEKNFNSILQSLVAEVQAVKSRNAALEEQFEKRDM